MAGTGGPKLIRVEDLVLDEENPRLAEEGRSQAQILSEWSRDRKNQRLATHVAAHGLSPIELVAVIPHPDLPRRFVVAEGNRRLTALKLLHQPSLAADDATAQRFRQIAKQHVIQAKVLCLVFASRAEADPWIELRHSGMAEGVGTVSWDTAQKYHFNVRRAKSDPNADAVRFLELAHERSWITPEQRRAVPVTSLRRVLGDTKARALLGVTITPDGPILARPEAEAKRLARALLAALSEKGAVRTIDKSSDRVTFVQKQLAAAKAKPATVEDITEPVEPPEKKGAPPRKAARRKRHRDTLAPRQLDFTVSHQRCDDILEELQTKIKVEKAPNAAVVLFRVFVELTTDHFLERRGAKPSRETSLQTKIRKCVEKLDGTAHQLSPAKKQALEKVLHNQHHPLNPDTLNAFVHNPELYPLPSELQKMWDQIQAFMSAVWRSLVEPSGP
jgi:hypothetical protein